MDYALSHEGLSLRELAEGTQLGLAAVDVRGLLWEDALRRGSTEWLRRDLLVRRVRSVAVDASSDLDEDFEFAAAIAAWVTDVEASGQERVDLARIPRLLKAVGKDPEGFDLHAAEAAIREAGL